MGRFCGERWGRGLPVPVAVVVVRTVGPFGSARAVPVMGWVAARFRAGPIPALRSLWRWAVFAANDGGGALPVPVAVVVVRTGGPFGSARAVPVMGWVAARFRAGPVPIPVAQSSRRALAAPSARFAPHLRGALPPSVASAHRAHASLRCLRSLWRWAVFAANDGGGACPSRLLWWWFARSALSGPPALCPLWAGSPLAFGRVPYPPCARCGGGPFLRRTMGAGLCPSRLLWWWFARAALSGPPALCPLWAGLPLAFGRVPCPSRSLNRRGGHWPRPPLVSLPTFGALCHLRWQVPTGHTLPSGAFARCGGGPSAGGAGWGSWLCRLGVGVDIA